MRAASMSFVVMLLACCGTGARPADPAPHDPGHDPGRGPGTLKPTPPSGVDVTPAARVHAEALLASVRADTLESHDRLLAHFDPEAIVLWPAASKIKDAIFNLRGAVLAEHPHDEVVDAKIANLIAGAAGSSTWIQFELQIALQESSGAKVARTVRVSELLGKSGKILAAAFGRDDEADSGAAAFDPPLPTEPGPLSVLAGDPAAAARTIRDGETVAVFGDGKLRATTPSTARPLLEAFKASGTFRIHGKPHEVVTAEVGFVQAHLDVVPVGGTASNRVGIFLIARPDGAGGWAVVSVHYTPLR
jgi:hypothetical protein